MAIINPRATGAVRALTRITLTHKSTTIIIRETFITINGVIEEAAMALAEFILKDLKKKGNAEIKYFSYISFEVYLTDDKVFINPKRSLMEPKDWGLLKKETEKICNNLKAFM